MKIIIDAGHGGVDNGGGSNSYWLEKNMNLQISKYQYEALKKLGFNVVLTRDSDITLGATQRANIVKSSESDLCISNHVNSFTDKSVSGAEVIYSIHSDKKLARSILDELVKEGAKKRRIFTKQHPTYPDKDYYYMHRNTGKVQTVIIEYGFASNEIDTLKILNSWKEYAEAVVSVVTKHLGYTYDEKVNRAKIMGSSQITIDQMQEWAISKGASQTFINAAENYMKYGMITGIRPDILYCQSAKETNYGKFTGIVKENMNNFANIKVKSPVGNSINNFEKFNSIDEGVRAHFNHIAAYIGKEPIGIVHDRYHVIKSLNWAGTIRYVKELSGKWSNDLNYGQSIIKDYLNDLEIYDFSIPSYKALYEKCYEEKKVLENNFLLILKSLQEIIETFSKKEV